jgi:hypothetical protein
MNDSIKLTPIGTYKTGIFDQGAAEIPAYDAESQRLFVVNANSATVDVLDLSDPDNPTQLFQIDATAYGGSANSVAVKNGVVAVAIESENPQEPGTVVFLDIDGNLLNTVTVGALPDMLTFTPDGQKVLVANEGEPNSDYTVDPEGSVSIIDLSAGVENATATIAGFSAFNDQIDQLRAAGVRIFGPNATVAQDLEPEYITVSSDSKTAWVTLQEGNALGVLNLETGEITNIVPLGFKDHNAAPELETFFFDAEELPSLGTVAGRGDIPLSGFSGLYFEGVNPETGNLQFITHPDRGPDGGETENGDRIFLLPDFQPEFVRFELNRETGDLTLTERIPLKRQDGTPLTGLPNLAGADPDVPIDPEGNPLEYDPLGADLEGIVRALDGTYWLADEYRPAIYHFTADGTLIDRYVPSGLPPELGTGALPEVYNLRRANRGFEAIAFQDGKVYAFVQSPLNNPESEATATIRILEFDPATETTTGEYLYIQDDIGGGSDKIGDAASIGGGKFLVIERDSGFGEESIKNVYRIDLTNATNLMELPPDTLATGETFDSLTPEQLAAKGITPVTKENYADLAALGYGFTDKPEGLAIVDPTTIAVLNDNDFGADPSIPIGLGLVTLQNGLDASNEDNAINIANYPIQGIYQPDAIASYTVNGETYLITANEGDTRDYDAFSEEERIADLTLDPTAFPNAAELQNDAVLGRLIVTTANGDTDGDGDFDQLYSFGGRSFSIWTSSGQLVYDSGNEFERITAELIPDEFNANNTENDSFDNRSDDKGPEPEGVTVGRVGDRTYAFIGLERVSGVMVYDVTEPTNPSFVQYINNRDFSVEFDVDAEGEPAPTAEQVIAAGDLGPEGLVFIAAEESPNGQPLLVVSNEVSGSTTVYEITPPDIVGTPDADQLIGTNATDTIRALAGNDLVAGALGNDTLFGDEGNDLLRGDRNVRSSDGAIGGDDVLYGGTGNDQLAGKGGNDQLYGEAGNDLLWGDSGDDLLRGGSGNDTVNGGRGQDTIVLAIGEGTDIIQRFHIDNDLIGLADGLTYDQLTITSGNNAARIQAGNETLAILPQVNADQLIANASTLFVAIA